MIKRLVPKLRKRVKLLPQAKWDERRHRKKLVIMMVFCVFMGAGLLVGWLANMGKGTLWGDGDSSAVAQSADRRDGEEGETENGAGGEDSNDENGDGDNEGRDGSEGDLSGGDGMNFWDSWFGRRNSSASSGVNGNGTNGADGNNNGGRSGDGNDGGGENGNNGDGTDGQNTGEETTRTIAEEVTIPYSEEKRNEVNLPRGGTKTLREGVEGKKKVTYKVTYRGGVEVGREVVSEKVTKEPVAKITLVGVSDYNLNNAYIQLYSNATVRRNGQTAPAMAILVNGNYYVDVWWDPVSWVKYAPYPAVAASGSGFSYGGVVYELMPGQVNESFRLNQYVCDEYGLACGRW